MCTATLYHKASPDSEESNTLDQTFTPPTSIQLFREKVVQCLVLGRYTKGPEYTIETLIIYMHIEYILNAEGLSQIWVLTGITLRLALRMGYHRDPSHYPRISPFQGEMRRRTWAVVSQLDAYGASQVGLPRMITESHCDTAQPSNLMDEEFDEASTSLPPSRPESFQSQIQYFVSKHRLVSVYGMISDLTTSTGLPAYNEVISLGSKLDEAKEKIPQWLKMREMSRSIMDSPELITHRIYADLQYHKARCVLHRRHLVLAWIDRRYKYSRTLCVESALEILKYQTLVDQETKPGGRLYQDAFKILAVSQSEFLLATTLLCLDLDHSLNAKAFAKSAEFGDDMTDVIMQALRTSYIIWSTSVNTSKESRKASEALQIILGKAQGLNTEEATYLAKTPTGTTPDAEVLLNSKSSYILLV